MTETKERDQPRMRRRLLTLALIGSALISAASQFSPSDPTEADRAAIRRVVGRRTSQLIDDMQVFAGGGVRVWTGRSGEAVEGDSFKLRKFFGGWWIYSREHWANRVERGMPEQPADPKELSGRFLQCDFTSAIYLTLSSNGTYWAKWEADVGNAGDASGVWHLQGRQLVLSPTNETGMMQNYLRTLDVYRFKTHWILVAARDRQHYERSGVTRTPLFHFQKDERE